MYVYRVWNVFLCETFQSEKSTLFLRAEIENSVAFSGSETEAEGVSGSRRNVTHNNADAQLAKKAKEVVTAEAPQGQSRGRVGILVSFDPEKKKREHRFAGLQSHFISLLPLPQPP